MARLLVCVTGSVAAIKTTELIEKIGGKGYSLKIVLTQSADYFLPDWRTVKAQDRIAVYRDHDEWPASGWNRGDDVLHIELRRWADAILIAPLDAHTLAKWANGLADNLLTNIIRAWDFHKPFLVAPAMNTLMWENPVTRRHFAQILADLNGVWPVSSQTLPSMHSLIQQFECHDKPVRIIPPVTKKLACGDTGIGAMADLGDIIDVLTRFVKPELD